MRLLFSLCITLLVSKSVLADTFQIQRLVPIERYGFFLLKNSTEDRITLDCSSYFHNLTIKNDYKELVYYLTVEECNDYYQFYKKFTLKRKCFSHLYISNLIITYR